ncbi:MAG: leucine-rich repeat domain-containing protein, partial [Clostridia bacterium]
MNKNRNNGITLIALIITIIVLLILAGITVSMLTGDNGLLNKTSEAQFKSDLSSFKEQLEIFKTSKIMENNSFSEDTLNASAGENTLQYNTKPAEETGNIEKIINNIDNKYKGKVEIIKGQLIYNTQSKQEIKWIQNLGLEANPYEINNGELASSEGNLLLLDSTGTLTIPSSVTKIGYGAFSGLSGLKKVIIPASVKEIGAYAFSNNKTLENVIIQGNLEKIGEYAFDGATNLKEINLPDSITEIGMRAFRYTAVTDIKLPENLTIISTDLFYECKLLSNIVLGNNLTTIQSGALQNTNISTIKFTEKIKDISGNSFYNCKNLQEIQIGSNKNFVYESGVLMSQNRKNVIYILDSVLVNQEKFEIPEGVEAFSVNISAYNIKEIVIPKTLVSLWNPNMPGTIKNIVVKEGNQQFISEDGILYNKNNELISCYSKEKDINIPEGII